MKSETKTINWKKVEHYLKNELNLPISEPIQVDPFTSGYSNLTYRISIGDWEGVLRRPPFGYLPPKAHDMEREYRLLSTIHPLYPKAPAPYLFCNDPDVMDRHFYVMELKNGVVIDDKLPEKWNNIEQKQCISETFIDELSLLHSIDFDVSSLGKPEGYLKRQVEGWITRYDRARTPNTPDAADLETYFCAQKPESPAATLVHNDFKLNNIMFKTERPDTIVAVFDWEMTTIGDPLLDLGISLAYWTEKDEAFTSLTAVTNQPGFYSRKQLAERYGEKTGRDLTNLPYYVSFAFYKIAAVLQQIYYRYKESGSFEERFERLPEGILTLIEQSRKAAIGEIV
ncbi:phosphotransferase family protein [Domibacillus epiphyticus]|uniref:phosphotransferase family protein n=1 Tax=Domibacillus epiphyticus TaxID=1714355 RepID=UPI001E5991B1|nr:phosphotransferase family protein [Domibacillus epiphyticus]